MHIMQRLIKYFLLLFFLGKSTQAFAIGSVTILADDSMSIAITELSRDYASKYNMTVSTSFLSSEKQELQIEDGEAADVLITPKNDWLEQLKTKGLYDVYSQIEVARNRLALVGPANSPLRVDIEEKFPAAELINEFAWEQSFVLGNPQALIEGKYNKDALRKVGASDYLEEYTLYTKKLDQIIDLIGQYHMYGVLFYSTTIGRDNLRVLDLFPENSHEPVSYKAVAIAGENMEAARNFLKYIQSDSAKIILRRNGFSVD